MITRTLTVFQYIFLSIEIAFCIIGDTQMTMVFFIASIMFAAAGLVSSNLDSKYKNIRP